MPPLNQISKEEIEKFDEKLMEYLDFLNLKQAAMQNRPVNEMTYPEFDRFHSLLLSSHLRLIDGMIELIKKKKIVVEREMNQYEVEHNQELEDLISKLQSEKENIKNENNK